MFFNMMECHHTSTNRWQHSSIGSCLSDRSANRVHFLASLVSRNDTPQLLSIGLCERWGLCSANAENPEQLEGSNTYSNCKTEQPLLQSVWYKIKYHLDVCRTTNEVYFEFAQGIKKPLWIALYNGVYLTFVWLLLFYQYISVIRPFVCW